MNCKNGAAQSAVPAKSPEKSSPNATQKHSNLFYISPSLFQNKRLRQKRNKWWAEVCKASDAKPKTDRRKQNLVALKADITIDLLSDDDEDTHANTPQRNKQTMQVAPSNNVQLARHNVVYQRNFELCKVPNITLIPVQNFSLGPLQGKHHQRKRKSRQPKRLSQPTIINSESIILTDDSETENLNSTATITTTTNHATPPPKPALPQIAQVDDEVTVSLVPRSSTTGSCAKTASSELFPMLPDETTVHTVIANRIYELSLTKLREGLASSGVAEFTNGQPKGSPTKQKANVNPHPPASSTPPVSLKLSSDLSISLISDDEEEQQDINPEKLMQQQPQLSVQQLHLPTAIQAGNLQTPRRRKLG